MLNRANTVNDVYPLQKLFHMLIFVQNLGLLKRVIITFLFSFELNRFLNV